MDGFILDVADRQGVNMSNYDLPLPFHRIGDHKWLKDFNDLLFNELLAYSKFF